MSCTHYSPSPAFLDCLQQFKEEVEKGDSGFCLPYEMEKGKIRDPATGTTYSVKMQFNSEEQVCSLLPPSSVLLSPSSFSLPVHLSLLPISVDEGDEVHVDQPEVGGGLGDQQVH